MTDLSEMEKAGQPSPDLKDDGDRDSIQIVVSCITSSVVHLHSIGRDQR
jgi:hypothetical protein